MSEKHYNTCSQCGCTDLHSCIDKKGNTCHWVSKNLCSHCKQYAFTKFSKSYDYPVTIYKTEVNLTNQEKKILWKELKQAFFNNTQENQKKLIDYYLKGKLKPFKHREKK